MDHAAIDLFIAGNWMPFLLGVLRGPWGWSLFGLVWGAAALGVAARMFNRLRHPPWFTGRPGPAGGFRLTPAVRPCLRRAACRGLYQLRTRPVSMCTNCEPG